MIRNFVKPHKMSDLDKQKSFIPKIKVKKSSCKSLKKLVQNQSKKFMKKIGRKFHQKISSKKNRLKKQSKNLCQEIQLQNAFSLILHSLTFFCSNPLPNGVIIMYLTCIFVCARYGTLSKVIYAHAAYIHSTHIHGSVTV